MSVDTEITVKDFRAFAAFVGRQRYPLLRFAEPLLFGVSCGLILNLLGALFHVEYHGPTMLITLFASIFTGLFCIGFRSRRMLPAEGGVVLGLKCVTIHADGLRQSSEHHDCLFRWSLVQRIGETRHHIFVMLDRNAGLIVPKSAFATPAECESFLAEVRKHSKVT